MINKEKETMNQLRREDLREIAKQNADEWEFNHHGQQCPHNMSTDAFKGIEDEGQFPTAREGKE